MRQKHVINEKNMGGGRNHHLQKAGGHLNT